MQPIKIKSFNNIELKNSTTRIIKSLVANVSFHFASPSLRYKYLCITGCYFDPSGSLISRVIETNFIFIIKSKTIVLNLIKI